MPRPNINISIHSNQHTPSLTISPHSNFFAIHICPNIDLFIDHDEAEAWASSFSTLASQLRTYISDAVPT